MPCSFGVITPCCRDDDDDDDDDDVEGEVNSHLSRGLFNISIIAQVIIEMSAL